MSFKPALASGSIVTEESQVDCPTRQSRLETPPLALHAARVRHGRHSAHGGSKWRFVNEAFQTTLSIPGAEGIRALGRLARGTTP